MKNAYKYVPVHLEDLHLQGFCWLGKFFVETSLIFGSASSVGSFNRFHEHLVVDVVLPQLKYSVPRSQIL